MDANELKQLDPAKLADYIWRRFRREQPIDPPLGDRFGEEEPEDFVLAALIDGDSEDFRSNLAAAIQANLSKLASYQAGKGTAIWTDPVFDEQLASLAFVAVETESHDLAYPIYKLVLSWVMAGDHRGEQWTLGQKQAVRAVAWLLEPKKSWAGFWEGLWNAAPKDLRGLFIFGWARADATAALKHLGEIVEIQDQIDLPSVLLTLVSPPGPGAARLGKAASKLAPKQAETILAALSRARATPRQIRDFVRPLFEHIQGAQDTESFGRTATELACGVLIAMHVPKREIDDARAAAETQFELIPFKTGRVLPKLFLGELAQNAFPPPVELLSPIYHGIGLPCL